MRFDLSPLERVFEHGPVEVLVYEVTVLPLCHVVIVLPRVDCGAEREGLPHLTDLSRQFLKKEKKKKNQLFYATIGTVGTGRRGEGGMKMWGGGGDYVPIATLSPPE